MQEKKEKIHIHVEHVRAARGLLGWTMADLSKRSGVSEITIMRWENGHHTPRPTTREKIRDAFEQEGIEFANGGDPGVRLFRSRRLRPTGHAPVN